MIAKPYLVGGFKHFLFPIIYGIILPIDIFFKMVKTTNQLLIVTCQWSRSPSHLSSSPHLFLRSCCRRRVRIAELQHEDSTGVASLFYCSCNMITVFLSTSFSENRLRWNSLVLNDCLDDMIFFFWDMRHTPMVCCLLFRVAVHFLTFCLAGQSSSSCRPGSWRQPGLDFSRHGMRLRPSAVRALRTTWMVPLLEAHRHIFVCSVETENPGYLMIIIDNCYLCNS